MVLQQRYNFMTVTYYGDSFGLALLEAVYSQYLLHR